MYSVLVVDDDVAVGESLQDIFTEIGHYQVELSTDPYDALRKISRSRFDIVLSDILMPGMDGLALLRRIKSIDSALPVVMITGFPSIDLAITAMKEGASDFFTKPFRLHQIKIMAERLIRERTLLLENADLHEALRQKKTIEALNTNLSAKINEISMLYSISESFSAPYPDEGIETVYRRLVEMAVDVTDSCFAVLLVIDQDSDLLIPAAGSGLLEVDLPQSVPAARFVWLEDMRCGARNPVHEPQPVSVAALDLPMHGCACTGAVAVPLVIRGEVFAVLVVGDCEASKRFDDNQLMLLENLARKGMLTIENTLLYESIYENMRDTLRSLVTAIEARDRYTLKHSIRVTGYSLGIADTLGCSQDEREILSSAGHLHDIGKIGITDSILLKQGRLTDEEYERVRQHPAIGENILRPLGFFPEERAIIRSHHERWDGTGYPDGLSGDTIPLLARIIAVADSYDAMTTDRPYRSALSPEAALSEIRRNRDQFDPVVVDAFVQHLRVPPESKFQLPDKIRY